MNNAITAAQAALSEPITVLTAFEQIMVKRFLIDDGQLVCVPYGQESHFYHTVNHVSGIVDLGNLVERLSGEPKAILIRGTAVPGLPSPIRRIQANFPEHPEGCRWVMLDFDDLSLPEDMSPVSQQAIEYAVSKLPMEFHHVSYYFQFSASAGVLRPDGTPLKKGLNVHLFFWLDQPIQGKRLEAFLIRHCIETGFYDKTLDRSGAPWIRWGIDPSVVRSSVQPLYVGQPLIGEGVRTLILASDRQGFVHKAENVVTLPELDENIRQAVADDRRRLQNAYKRECGFTESRLVTRSSQGGIAVTNYYRPVLGTSPSENRTLSRTEPYGEDDNALVLFFEGENSPGSWYVSKSSPSLARHFGGQLSMPLKELSETAYGFISDQLRWFTEVQQDDAISLTPEGYLPDIQSFSGTARNVLIEAPTGSGKTSAFCRFAAVNRNTTIIYAAQTRALVQQMYDDLTSAGIYVAHYMDFYRGAPLCPCVYVTTNESLRKFIQAALDQGEDYLLVVDEAHSALDDFMTKDDKNQLLERAISRARRSFFMTATITELQIQKLLDTISRACGALTPEVYAGYRFAPVKANPLILKPVGELGQDFIALARQYHDMKKSGTPLPRIVIITPTSRMRVFENVLDAFGLLGDAHIVSRQESTPREIEEARTSDKPILISSPMFALGLNFVHQPVRFWTWFSYLPVDTSQIIQTLNRANRGTQVCEVRLYHGDLDNRPIWIPPAVEERMKIQGYLVDESSVQGVLDAHYHVDRPTYNQLRAAEKKTARAMSWLIEGDRIQNYRIALDWQETLVIDRRDREMYKSFNAIARESYLDEIAEQAANYAGENQAMLLFRLELLQRVEKLLDSQDSDQVIRQVEAETKGVMMVLCGIEDPALMAKVKPHRLRRLFGDMRPYLTGQFNPDRTDSWRNALAEKTLAIVPLLSALKSLRSGEIDGIEFAAKMRRPLRGSVKALADGESNYLMWQRRLDKLDSLSKEIRLRASDAQRVVLKEEQFGIVLEFLSTLGVSFKEMKLDGRCVADPSQPVVPDWNFDSMAFTLQRNVLSLKRLPQKPNDMVHPEEYWAGAMVSQELCRDCVHAQANWHCALGRPVQWIEDEAWAATKECDGYKRIPLVLQRQLPTKNVNSVGSPESEMPVVADGVG